MAVAGSLLLHAIVVILWLSRTPMGSEPERGGRAGDNVVVITLAPLDRFSARPILAALAPGNQR